MNDILDIEIILKRQKYPKIYDIGVILTIIIAIFIYIIFTYDYQSYYIMKGKMIDNTLELLVDINELKYLEKSNILEIENNNYSYKIIKISEELYIDELYNNYKYVYLKISNLTNIDNYVYEVKIPKEKKKIAKYLKEYI